MAYSTNNVNLELIKFQKNISYSFLRRGRLDPYTSTSITAPIRRIADLAADGKQINIPLVDQLRSDGVSTGPLVGAEEGIDNYGMPMWADWARNAVAFKKSDKKESAINIRNTASPLLAGWVTRIRRDDEVDMLLSIPTSAIMTNYHSGAGNRVNGIRWRDATSTQRNNWAIANADRIVFGHLVSNYVAGNVASSLANVGSASDKMTAAIGDLMKRTAAQTTDMSKWPAIQPWRLDGEDGVEDQEWYLCLLGSRAMRDLRADPVMYQANRDAREREGADPTKTNPIFTGGSLVYGGVIYKEIPEITTRYLTTIGGVASPLVGAGASSVDVEPVFMLGASAYAHVIGQLPKRTRRNETDYEFIEGIGTEMQYGVGKIAKDLSSNAGAIGTLKDWGVVTGFVAAPPDA
jgi:hypothetical protein